MVNETSRSVGTYQLLNSYRSSKEITRLFQTLGTQPEQLTIVPIRHDGEKHLFLVTLRLTILKQSSLPLQPLIRKKAPPLLLKLLQKKNN